MKNQNKPKGLVAKILPGRAIQLLDGQVIENLGFQSITIRVGTTPTPQTQILRDKKNESQSK